MAIHLKAVLLIADGLGGRPTDYYGKTCLEAAHTPNIDELAKRGVTGLLDPIKPGVRPGSDTAHLSIFGYNPEKVYTGRGVFEALGIGMNVKEGDVCFRTNFATVDEKLNVLDRRAGRITEGAKELEKALQNLKPSQPDVKVFFKASTEHRGALVLRGKGLSDEITDADPHKTGVKMVYAKPLVSNDSARRTAELVNEIVKQSYDLLKNVSLNRKREREGKPPANILLLRGASIKTEIPSLKELYGVKGVAIAGGALYLGIAKALGLETKKAEGTTGGADSKIINKAKLAVKELRDGKDFVFIHLKGADSCAHDHDAEAKIKYIQKVDEVVGFLIENLDWEETHLVFTGDHTTPIVYGDHVSDPVPIVFVGPNVTADDVKEFNEKSVLKGGLGRISGRVVPILFGYCNWLKKYGS